MILSGQKMDLSSGGLKMKHIVDEYLLKPLKIQINIFLTVCDIIGGY